MTTQLVIKKLKQATVWC